MKKILGIGMAGIIGLTGATCLTGCDSQDFENEIQKYQQESEQQIADLNSQLLALTGYYEACLEEKRIADAQLEEKIAEISALNTEIKELNATISAKATQIEQNETEISSLEAQKETLAQQIATLREDDQNTIASLNGQIEAINAQIATLEQQNSELTERKSQLEQNLSVAQASITTLVEEKSALGTQIAQKNSEIAVLQANQPKAKVGKRYYMSFEDAVSDVSTEDMVLYADAEITDIALNNQELDLNGKTLKVSKSFVVNGDVTIKNGTLILTNATNKSQSNITVGNGETLTIENVVMSVNGAGIGTEYNVENAEQTIIIKNSTITSTGYYAVATNANKMSVTNNITIENSTISVSNDENDNCAVCFNTKGNITIKNSNISGQRQAVMVRAGSAIIEYSTITVVSTFTSNSRNTGVWSSGNEVSTGALIVGNKDCAGYNTKANVTIKNSTISGTNAEWNEALVFNVYVVETNTVGSVEYSANVTYLGE